MSKTIYENKQKIDELMGQLEVRIVKLRNEYQIYSNNTSSDAFVFGIDSLYFQFNLLYSEFKNFKKQLLLIFNRIYCENYKLYKLIIKFITEHITDKSILNMISSDNFPPYKDLEPYKEYSIDEITNIYKKKTLIIKSLKELLRQKNVVLTQHKMKKNIGYNIHNFVLTSQYEVDIFEKQIEMFEEYAKVIDDIHLSNINYIISKIDDALDKINKDVSFDEDSLNTYNNTLLTDKDDCDMDSDNDDDIINYTGNKLIHDTKNDDNLHNISDVKMVVDIDVVSSATTGSILGDNISSPVPSPIPEKSEFNVDDVQIELESKPDTIDIDSIIFMSDPIVEKSTTTPPIL